MLFGKPAQPFLGNVGDVDRAFARHRLDALEDVREDLVETVDVALVLHQRGARQIVEPLDVIGDEVRVHALEQGQIFAQRDRNAGGFQLEEEGDEHGCNVLRGGLSGKPRRTRRATPPSSFLVNDRIQSFLVIPR